MQTGAGADGLCFERFQTNCARLVAILLGDVKADQIVRVETRRCGPLCGVCMRGCSGRISQRHVHNVAGVGSHVHDGHRLTRQRCVFRVGDAAHQPCTLGLVAGSAQKVEEGEGHENKAKGDDGCLHASGNVGSLGLYIGVGIWVVDVLARGDVRKMHSGCKVWEGRRRGGRQRKWGAVR